MSVLGLGHDVIDVSAFAEQLAEPGSRMRGLFSVREVRQAGERARRKNDDESTHLAAKWAGKEAVLKAWCDALGDMPNPYTIENFPWNGIEIVDDSRGRPCVALRPDVERKLRASLPPAASRNSDEMSGAPGLVRMGPPVMRMPIVTPVSTGSAPAAASSASVSLVFRWHVSLSHDGGIASAVAMLTV